MIKRVFLTLIMSLMTLSISTYAAPLNVVKPDIKSIAYYGGRWNISYSEVQNGTNLKTEEVFVDGVSDRVVNIGTLETRAFPMVGAYTQAECHKAYVVVYNASHTTVTQSNIFNFGNISKCDGMSDTINPVLTLTGANPQKIVVGTAYNELGATAFDDTDGEITSKIVIDSTAVDTTVEGDYSVTYSVLDAAGNDTIVNRTVKVVAANTVATANIFGVNYYGGNWNIAYKDLPASANLGVEKVFVDGTMDRQVNAGTTITSLRRGFKLLGAYNAATCHTAYIVIFDKLNQEVTRTANFNFGDTTKCGDVVKPVITLTGANPQVFTVGDAYIELGAIATDDVDGDITGNIVIDATAVNTAVAGTYTVTYNVADTAINAATTVTRTVQVNAAPAATSEILAIKYYNGNWNIAYKDLPASSNLGVEKLFVDGTMDRQVNAGTTITSLRRGFRLLGAYNAATCHTAYIVIFDKANQEVTRTANFNFGNTAACGGDIVKPVITLVGANPQVVVVGQAYTELGAIAADNVDGDITGNIVIDATAVNTAVAGTYTVTYNVADAATNAATTVTRTVTVQAVAMADRVKPVITLVGANPQAVVVGQAYTELGATAIDNVDGDITGNIVIDATAVNTAVAGTYTVTYNVADTATNAATTVTRVVKVSTAVDSVKPNITLIGANPLILTVGQAYTELGATATDDIDGDITGDIVIDSTAVNTATVGEYYVNYTVMDQQGNSKTERRTVSVRDAGTTTGNYYISLNGNDNNDGRTLGTAFKTIAHALSVANGGETILMQGGEYRQGKIKYRKENSSGQYVTLQNYNNERVVIKGSKVVTGWTNYQGNIWKLPSAAADNSGLDRAVHFQQVFFGEGKRLQKVGLPNYKKSGGAPIWYAGFRKFKPIKENANNPFGMSEGTFYVEELADGTFDLYVWLPNGQTPNDAGVRMEVSDEHYLLNAFNVENFKIKGISFMHTAAAGFASPSNSYQGGSAVVLGKKAILEDSEIAYTDFAGLNLSLGLFNRGTDMQQIIRRNKIHHNGDVGISATAGGYVIENNEFSHNGLRPFIQYWHSGAIKTSANGWGEIKDNYIHDESGQGIWFDNCHSEFPIRVHHNYLDSIGNRTLDSLNNIYRRGHGLFFEQSTNIRAYNNIINNTAQRGIYTSLSRNVVISNNLIRKSNLEQLAVRYRDDYGTIKLYNVKVVNNIFLDNGGTTEDFKAFHEQDVNAVFSASNEFKNNIIYNSNGVYKVNFATSHWNLADNFKGVNPLLLTNGSTLMNTWRLNAASPAIDTATSYPFITDDINHNLRNDGTPDIGAFEN